jgi:hypothetical protein
VLDWLSAALAAFTFAAGSEWRARADKPQELRTVGCSSIPVLELLFAEGGMAYRTLEALGDSGAVALLRQAFAGGHEAVLELCWEVAPAAGAVA